MPKRLVVDPLSLDFGRDKRFCVYIYRDPRPRKRKAPIYVGKGLTNKRPDDHWRADGKNPIFNRILAKMRASKLIPIIEYVGFFEEEREAFALEIALIKRYGRRDNGTGSLANLTDGGEGLAGHIFSAVTRKILSENSRHRMALLSTEERVQLASNASAAVERVAWINDGTINKRIKEDAPIPNGWVVGRINFALPLSALQAAKDTQWINNGIRSRRVSRGSELPAGWSLGRKIKPVRLCACGCGQQLSGRGNLWARGHAIRRPEHQINAKLGQARRRVHERPREGHE